MISKTQRLIAQATAAAMMTAAIGLALAPSTAPAQGATVSSDSQRVSGVLTVKAVDLPSRHMVVTDSAGDEYELKVPTSVRNFEQIKPGHKIKATYTLATEFVISRPNTPLPKDAEASITARAAKGELPAGVVANHVVVTGAVLGIDMAKHTLKIVSPQGGEVHTIYVRNADRQKAMAKLKVGDTITAYITESLVVAVSPA